MTSKNLPTGLAAVEKAHQERSGPIESNWEGYALSGRVHYCRSPSSRRLFRITLPLLRPLNLIMAALKRDCQRSECRMDGNTQSCGAYHRFKREKVRATSPGGAHGTRATAMRRTLLARLDRLERKLKPDSGVAIILYEADDSGPVRSVSGGHEWSRAPGECAADFESLGEAERLAKTLIFITPFEAGIG